MPSVNRLLASLLLALLTTWLAPSDCHAQKPVVKVMSPTPGTTYAYGDIKRRTLTWKKKEKKLYAEVTFTDEKYAASGTLAQQDTLMFEIPGATLDEKTGVVFLPDEKGGLWEFARTKKQFLGTTLAPVDNAVVRVVRFRSSVEVTAEIYKPEDVAQSEVERKEAEKRERERATKEVDRSSVLGN